MALTNQLFFTASINGVNIQDIRSMIDYEKNTYEERLKVVNDALEKGDEFFQTYFDEHQKASINNSDFLLSDGNVVRSLEGMASYLLMSEDVKSEKLEKTYIVHEENLEKKSKTENEIGNDGNSLIEGAEDKDDDFISKSKSNFKKTKTQKITSKDLSDNSETAKVLKEYQSFIDNITEKLKSGNTEGRRYLYTKHKGSLKDDMIICKDQLNGVFGYSLKYFSESTVPDYGVVDFTNIRHLVGAKIEYPSTYKKAKGLLYFTHTEDLQNDFNCILVDLQNIINLCDLTERELEVLDMIRANMSIIDISRELEILENTAKRDIFRIAKKVSKKAIELGYKSKGGIKNVEKP